MDTSQFLGLNNVQDPLNMGLAWMTQADNIDISSTGKPGRRDGFTLTRAATTMAGAYGTLDRNRMYLVADGDLVTGDGVVLATGLDSALMHWTEINGLVFYNNGVQRGIIRPDNTLMVWEWEIPATPDVLAIAGSMPPGLYRVACTHVLADGRETGTSDAAEIELAEGQALQISGIPQLEGARTRTYIAAADSVVFNLIYSGPLSAITWDASVDDLGIETTTGLLSPLPKGAKAIAHWRGKIYAAHYDPQAGTSALWQSLALGWHLFDLEKDYSAINGEILMLAPHDQALVIGTSTHVYALNADGLTELATYGTVPGCPWAIDDLATDKAIYFWTLRGMCRFPNFANLTHEHVSVAPGVQAGAAVMHANGQKRFVVALHQGGTPFNSRS